MVAGGRAVELENDGNDVEHEDKSKTIDGFDVSGSDDKSRESRPKL
jgi:hypothetical protein